MRLRQLQDAVLAYARDFDAARLSARDAARVIERVAVMKNALGGIEAMAAARASETKVWAESGDRSAAHHLARTTGVSIAQASDALRMLRGSPAEGETCEIAGYGPVAVSAVRDLLATGQPLLAAVLTKGKDVVSVTHLKRRPTAHQRTALEWLYPECEVEGCHNSAFIEWDHVEPWSQTHVTKLGSLGGKCSHHHWLKSVKGWDMVPGKGKRPMVPPDDPRHPRNRRNGESSKDPPEVAA